ncbi:hypothetical protein [Mechercharimyces sp. CAU 1602]|uniref:hypothetical protein n=1 Tax=Mechercharimyces sp. CAU 1602 TaxID=2973933 RepID=UPI0021634F94|nr:hypothetical protein [Mechercharimyces sp. CAU 1602]MCS1351179.1 hypothetical protein [Mechercharimyces sp. CAU 1602]
MGLNEYKVRWTFDREGEGLNYLKGGDKLVVEGVKEQCGVRWVSRQNDEVVYGCTNIGIVYARELTRI